MTADLNLVYILGIQANWENWKKKNPNNLGYTENISKSTTPHSASDKVFRLIFVQPFYAINLICWSKNRETCQSINIFWSKEILKTIVSSTPSDSLSKSLPLLYDLSKIPHKIYIDCPHSINFKHVCERLCF